MKTMNTPLRTATLLTWSSWHSPTIAVTASTKRACTKELWRRSPSGSVVYLYTAESTDLSQCVAYLGRNCVANESVSSGSLNNNTTSFLSQFSGKHIVAATYVPKNAGNTLPT